MIAGVFGPCNSEIIRACATPISTHILADTGELTPEPLAGQILLEVWTGYTNTSADLINSNCQARHSLRIICSYNTLMANAYCKLLQSLIKNYGQIQQEISRQAGITNGYLSRIASGQESPATPETNTAIARACGASQQEIAELTFLETFQRHSDLLAVVD